MGRMKYHPAEPAKPAQPEPARLIFPAQALDEARKSFQRQPAPRGSGFQTMARRIEEHLERAQEKLDQLKDDIENYPFPGSGNSRPPRAA